MSVQLDYDTVKYYTPYAYIVVYASLLAYGSYAVSTLPQGFCATISSSVDVVLSAVAISVLLTVIEVAFGGKDVLLAKLDDRPVLGLSKSGGLFGTFFTKPSEPEREKVFVKNVTKQLRRLARGTLNFYSMIVNGALLAAVLFGAYKVYTDKFCLPTGVRELYILMAIAVLALLHALGYAIRFAIRKQVPVWTGAFLGGGILHVTFDHKERSWIETDEAVRDADGL